MKTAGIICEYNPFHAGHARQIAITRERGYDRIICVMSGNVTQRGDFASLGKWSRARAALENGADAVFLLAALWSCRTADKFALGGVCLLDALGADAISFGCETDNIGLLNEIAISRESETDAVKKAIAECLSKGNTLARARGEAEREIFGDISSAPNATLGIEYLRAIRKIGSDMRAEVILRDTAHDSADISASAKSIREAAFTNPDIAKKHTPAPRQIDEIRASKCIDDVYLFAIRSMGIDGLKLLPDSGEGLAERMFDCAKSADTLENLLTAVKCKRYTLARIRRLALHAVIGLTAKLANENPAPRYAIITGMRDGFKPVSNLPLLRPVDLKNDAVFSLECRATDTWALTRTVPSERRAGREFTEKFIRA